MYIPRTIERRLRAAAAAFPAVVVTGGRQTGKTTLLRHLYPDYSYVSLDLPSAAAQAESDPGRFLGAHPAPLIVDEIQYAPALLRHLKVEIDANRHAMGRSILTGSQHFPLMAGVTESLAGRIAVLELETLSMVEVPPGATQSATGGSLAQRIVRGHFPELWRRPDASADEFYSSYLATYLERDVRQILNVTSLRDFERFLRILAARTGQMLNRSDVARDVGVSVKAIGDWLSVLEASGQVSVLEPWFVNFGKRLVKTPKVYFRETGLLCYLLNLTAATLATSPFAGAVWETFVYAELRKAIASTGDRARLWYYRDQRAREIDFVIERAGTLSFLEAKWTENPSRQDAATIAAISAELAAAQQPWRPGHHAVVATPAYRYPISDGITATGIYEFVSDADAQSP